MSHPSEELYQAALNHIHAVVERIRSLQPGQLEAGNHTETFRVHALPDMVGPLLESYVSFASRFTDGAIVSRLQVAFFQRRVSSPIDQILSKIRDYANNGSPNPQMREDVFTECLTWAQDAQLGLNLARAALDTAAIDLIVPRALQAAKLEQDATALLATAKETLAVASLALEQSQAAARTAGVVGNVQAFQAAADSYGNAVIGWGLLASIVAVTLLVWASSAISDRAPYPVLSWTIAGNLYYLGEHIFLASVLSFAMVTFVRNFRAASHNQVVNKHRQRALQTFEQLRAGTGDERMKDAILLQAAEAAFSIQPSGFERREDRLYARARTARARQASEAVGLAR